MPSVIAYSEPNYSGTAYLLDAGPQDIATVDIASVRVPLGWSVTLYRGNGFSGTTLNVRTDTPQIATFRASSADVRANAVFYGIRPQHSNNKALDVSGASQDDRAHVIQYGEDDRDNQQFLLVRDDDGFYVICARHSGKVLDVALNPIPDLVNHIIQYRPHGQDNQKFRLVDTNGSWRIDAKHSGQAWDIAGASTADRAHLIQHPSNGAANQRFRMRGVDSHTLPVRQGREVNSIGDIPRMTGFVVPPDEGPRYLIGESWIPYFLVNDGQTPDRVKINESPFYRLSRYGFWKLLYYYDFDTGVDEQRTFSYEVGLTVGTTTQTETTLGLTIGADATISVAKWLGFKLSGSVERTWKTTVTQTTQAATKTTRSVQKRYPAGPRLAEAGWGRADLFVVSRMDGTEVLRWQLVNDNLAPVDRWP